jgi:hypothetical protein
MARDGGAAVIKDVALPCQGRAVVRNNRNFGPIATAARERIGRKPPLIIASLFEENQRLSVRSA